MGCGVSQKGRGSSWSPQGTLCDFGHVRGLRPVLVESRERMGWDMLSGRVGAVNGGTRSEGAVAATTLTFESQVSWVLRNPMGPAQES